jgi:hypothetical protein
MMKVKGHSGCLLNERADEHADYDRIAEGPKLCPGPKKHSFLWLRVTPIVREYADQCKKQLPRYNVPKKHLLDSDLC